MSRRLVRFEFYPVNNQVEIMLSKTIDTFFEYLCE